MRGALSREGQAPTLLKKWYEDDSYSAICLLNLSRFLVAKDEPDRCDTAVLLMGSGSYRMTGSVDLYRRDKLK